MARMHARTMYDPSTMIQDPYDRQTGQRADIRAACRGDCLAHQTHTEPYQHHLLNLQQQAGTASSSHHRRVLPRQLESSIAQKPRQQLQTVYPQQISPMGDAWAFSTNRGEAHESHCQHSSGQPGSDWPRDSWPDKQPGFTGQASLDPRQLQNVVNQAEYGSVGLGIHGLNQQDLGHSRISSRYTSPSYLRDDLAPARNHRVRSRQATPYECSPVSDVIDPDTDADDEDPAPNEPYNQLLHRCLLQQPNHELLLKDIYEWFKLNTDKGRDPRQKGWQNSIRHNLSMNPAFHKGSRSQPDASITNLWSLTDKAIAQGVEPTTRFRNHNRPFQRGKAFRAAVPQRQLSGAKGGRAARRSTRLRAFATPDDSRSPSPALGFYNTPPTTDYQPHTGFTDATNQSDADPWQTMYNHTGSGGPYFLNSLGTDQTCTSAMPGMNNAYANQFDDTNHFNFSSELPGFETHQPPQTSHPSYVRETQGMTGLPDQVDGRCQTLPPTESSSPCQIDYKVSGAHSDSSGEPLFTNSGDEDSSVELEMPKTPQLGESVTWNDEGAGMFFNFDDK